MSNSQGLNKNAILVAAVVLFAGFFVWMTIRSVSGEDPSGDRMFIDTGVNPPAPFRSSLSVGMTTPIKAPSGGNTGYPAEACFWTKDGKSKSEPTYVLLNDYTGKPGPTFCPDCGRLVRHHNPIPEPGKKAPPTQAEYKTKPVSDESQDR